LTYVELSSRKIMSTSDNQKKNKARTRLSASNS
jgi:hypothetical protein